MCQKWIASGVTVLTVVMFAAGAENGTPAARIAHLQGRAIIVNLQQTTRPASLFATLHADEQIEVAADSQVLVNFPQNGRVERVVAAGRYRITPDGCDPRQGVERLPLLEHKPRSDDKSGRNSRSVLQRRAVVVPPAVPAVSGASRAWQTTSQTAVTPAGMRPYPNSTLLETQPTFTWPAVPNATRYTLHLHHAAKRIWSVDTEKPEREYTGAPTLAPAAVYSWEVTTFIQGKPTAICQGMFRTASLEQREQAAAVARWLPQHKPDQMALAAIWYRENGFLREAIAVVAQLAARDADPAILGELRELYALANETKLAQEMAEKR